MSPIRRRGYLLLGAFALAALAVASGDAGVAALFALGALLLGAAYLVGALWPAVHWPELPIPVAEADPLVTLRNSFYEGRYGRETILARLDALDRDLGRVPAAYRLSDRVALLAAPDRVFLDAVETRIAEIERLS